MVPVGKPLTLFTLCFENRKTSLWQLPWAPLSLLRNWRVFQSIHLLARGPSLRPATSWAQPTASLSVLTGGRLVLTSPGRLSIGCSPIRPKFIPAKGNLSLSFQCLLYSLLLLLLSCFSHVWLCDPIDGSPTGSAIPGILQARTLEWVAISFSSAWKWKVKVKMLSHVRLLATPWTSAYQAPPSMGFSRQEYWSGVPLPSPLYSLLFPKLHIILKLYKCNAHFKTPFSYTVLKKIWELYLVFCTTFIILKSSSISSVDLGGKEFLSYKFLYWSCQSASL